MQNETANTSAFETTWDEDQAYLHRQAWALFGQLVLLQVIPMPNFDLFDPEDFKKAGDHLHRIIMSLSTGLERIDQQPLA